MSPQDRLREVAGQLRGIGGSRSIGFGPQRVLSLPDAVAQALATHLTDLADAVAVAPSAPSAPASSAAPAPASAPAGNGTGNGIGHGTPAAKSASRVAALPLAAPVLTGNICPSCGSSSAFVFEEGCKKCHNCGYSEC
jgi:ribonucleoside-diphosphate reductase alpha chain